jgi:hypothetical protein
MKKIWSILCIGITFLFLAACGNENKSGDTQKNARPKHHLNIPASGIESLVEANTQKIIEGTDGSIVITVGEITRKKVSISVRKDDEIVDEQIIAEKESMAFDYEGIAYEIEVKNLKKPLIGAGKAEISIHQK